MVYIKIDKNRNNRILDVSGEHFSGLTETIIEVYVSYDFPSGQKLFFYRWNEIDGKIEVNSEDVIKTFYEEKGVMTGLDLEPHVDKLVGGEFLPNTTKNVIIEGVNFSPFSTVEISGEGNFVNTTFFKSPIKIEVEINVGNDEGLFNIVINNDQLTSKDSGNNKIVIKSKTIVDLRTTDMGLLGIEKTSNITITQDNTKGLRFTSNTNSWNRGVKIGGHSWNREDDITYEVVFTRTSNVLFMVGLASTNLDVTTINSAYYKQEIGLYHNNNIANTMYGGGDVTNWSQGIGANVVFDENKFYKLKLDFSGAEGYDCSLSEVDGDDWDDENIIHVWKSNCPADDLIICPFILPQASSGAYYITGFRY